MKLPEIEISIKYKGAKRTELKKVQSSSDVYEILKQMYNEDQILWSEQAILICLNNANKVIGYYKISQGGITGTVMDARRIFTTALNCAGTTQIIVSHNHPSGNIFPSSNDKTMTRKLRDAGELLDIKLIDHIIYTDEGYYSFMDEGEL
jgi:DNA repair protein RadC